MNPEKSKTAPKQDKQTNSNVGPLVEYTHQVRVSYRDTDAMGRAYYANYLVYFENARGAMMRWMGHSYADAETRGIFMPIAEAHCEYKSPARYDDVIAVRARVRRWTRVRIEFEYECRNQQSGKLLATGWTRQVFTDSKGKILRRGHELMPDQEALVRRYEAGEFEGQSLAED